MCWVRRYSVRTVRNDTMRDFLTYTGIFLTAIALQFFVVDPMQVWMYLNPLVYVAFIILLPANTKPVVVLLLGLLTGVVMDFFTGMGGLHTVVTLFTAYLRRFVMIFTLGREYTIEGEGTGMPSVKSLGGGKFLRYAGFMVAVHCLLYFALESLTWRYFYIVLLKTVVSWVVTLFVVWLVSLLFTVRTHKKT